MNGSLLMDRVTRRAGVALQSIVLAACLAGCGQAVSLDPPRLIQLTCKPDKSQDGMVFVLDTAQRKVRWVNARTAVEGLLEVTARDYRLALPGTPLTQGLKGAINRYDGRLDLIWGPPLHKPGLRDEAQGADSRTWRCKKEKAGPEL